MGKDPTKPGGNCQEKQNSLLVVTSPPARVTSAMSSVTEQFVSPSSCHCTGQVLECIARYPLYVALQQWNLRVGDIRNQHKAISGSVLVCSFPLLILGSEIPSLGTCRGCS